MSNIPYFTGLFLCRVYKDPTIRVITDNTNIKSGNAGRLYYKCTA